jgi:hypothetical protein
VDCSIPPCSASTLFNQKGRYDDIYDQYLKDGDVDKARRDIADLRRVEQMGDGRTYEKYYGDFWDTEIKPKIK